MKTALCKAAEKFLVTKEIEREIAAQGLKLTSLKELGYKHMEEFAGSVLITKGKYKGKIGYYDDDEVNGEEGYYAIVYPGELNEGYILIDHEDLLPLVNIGKSLALN